MTGMLVLLAVLGCAAKGEHSAGGVQVTTFVPCGGKIDDLVRQQPGGLTMIGQFPPKVERKGQGMFTGTVTATGLITGITSPEADIYLAKAGQVVATPLPKDSIGQPIDLKPGTSHTFSARGSVRSCASIEPIPAGQYDIYAVVVVTRGHGPTVAVGGPWPIEVE
jgi:hypothetical protein